MKLNIVTCLIVRVCRESAAAEEVEVEEEEGEGDQQRGGEEGHLQEAGETSEEHKSSNASRRSSPIRTPLFLLFDARSASFAARRAPWCSLACLRPMPRRPHALPVHSCPSCPPGAPSSTLRGSWPTWSAKRGSSPLSPARTPLTKDLEPRGRDRGRGTPVEGTPCGSGATVTATTRTRVRQPPPRAPFERASVVRASTVCGSLIFLCRIYLFIHLLSDIVGQYFDVVGFVAISTMESPSVKKYVSLFGFDHAIYVVNDFQSYHIILCIFFFFFKSYRVYML
ncbi:uncharacterized protein LOC122258163 [Penaeus japonicus]|uniref:uncharacterized protein LOC122258163 n=1 Tax=Penaeus japonicus TaxID=27405 RepID=UPI001C713A58|nr:uncharacterized protein LOC122258163 [Penaeus japonicus]